MNPKLRFIFILVSALSGCATGPAQLMQEAPELVHTSDKPAETVAKCIDKKWEEVRVIGGSNIVDSKTTDSGIRVTQRFGDTVHFVALVSSRANGSRTQLWTQKAIGQSKQRNDVAVCQ